MTHEFLFNIRLLKRNINLHRTSRCQGASGPDLCFGWISAEPVVLMEKHRYDLKQHPDAEKVSSCCERPTLGHVLEPLSWSITSWFSISY